MNGNKRGGSPTSFMTLIHPTLASVNLNESITVLVKNSFFLLSLTLQLVLVFYVLSEVFVYVNMQLIL